MIKSKAFPIYIVIFILAFTFSLSFAQHEGHGGKTEKAQKERSKTKKPLYYCPMHPGYTSERPGDCPICNMKLVKKEEASQERKVLYYRNPMNPEVTSPVPIKDSMGMDYVPVYEAQSKQDAGIFISPQKQQLVGIKKEKVEKRKLAREIVTVGAVAYDPNLFVAQQEYLQALRIKDRLSDSSIRAQAESLAQAAKKKLLLLGMSEEEITELSARGEPQGNLYLPSNEDKVWVYGTIYEYDIGLVKPGQGVTLESVAYPGESFEGKIIAITPVLDAMTRSVQARIEAGNPERKLKPEMFVNVRINVELGDRLAAPEEAVVETGERNVVFVASSDGYFSSREVTLGVHAGDYYEVISGLEEGEEIVSSGNFFVDSESRLKSVISSEEHKHNQ